MALISPDEMQDLASNSFVASLRLCHHISGSCSAHPGCIASMGISSPGEYALAIQRPVSASIILAFTEELPMSYPSRNIIAELNRTKV
jgi:hypothetical protein